jgi:hypothetical protein
MKKRYALRYELTDGTVESDAVLFKNNKREALRAARDLSRFPMIDAVSLWVEDNLKDTGVKRFSLPSWESIYN